MREKRGHPTFKVGDIVKIVETPFRECPFHWVSPMDDYCGMETVITGMHYSDSFSTYCYYIDADDSGYSWCSNCFVEVQTDIEESELSIDVLIGGALS